MRLGRAPDARTAALRDWATGAGIDTSHITNPNARTYTDHDLAAAVRSSTSWAQVRRKLGKHSGASVKNMRRLADKLHLDVTHLQSNPDRPAPGPTRDAQIFRAYTRDRQSFVQIGAQFQLSPERVRQIVRREEKTTAGVQVAEPGGFEPPSV